MTSRSYFGKMNSTLGSVVPLAMFLNNDMHSKISIFRCRHVSHNMLGHYVPCRVVLPVGRIMAQKTLVMPIAKLSQLTQHLRPYN